MASLEIQHVSVDYDSAPVLRDVALEVPSGGWLAIVGPNGSGKTTLLRAIAAAMPLSAGCVLMDRQDVAALKPRARAARLAVVPQEQALPAGWTVAEVVAQGRSPHLGPWRGERQEDRDAVARALQSTATSAFADRSVESLSGGERQRVLLARALAQEPKVLLLDEPTAFLDLQYQWEMLEMVEQARRQRGLTVVSVLHDLNLAAAFAGRIALLKGGRIIALGTPDEVLTEETIRRGYNRRVTISRHPATGRPTVVSWPSAHVEAEHSTIHVIGGGGSGAALIRRLVADGHTVTAGALNVGDTDWEAARALGLEVADEAPFSPLSPEALREAERLVAAADDVIVAPTAFGPGNLDNLRLASEAAQRGQRVTLVGAFTADRDFTDGAAAALWREAVEHGAVVVPDAARATARLAVRRDRTQ